MPVGAFATRLGHQLAEGYRELSVAAAPRRIWSERTCPGKETKMIEIDPQQPADRYTAQWNVLDAADGVAVGPFAEPVGVSPRLIAFGDAVQPQQSQPERQSHVSVSSSPVGGMAAAGAAQQPLPCQASRPSLTAMAAMTRAAIEDQADQEHRGQVGAQQRLLGVGDRARGAELATCLALGVGEERHDREGEGGYDDAGNGMVALGGGVPVSVLAVGVG